MALTDLTERLALIVDARTDGAVTSMRQLSVAEKQAGEQADVLRAKIADLEARGAKRPLTNTAGLQLSKAKSELAGLESQLAAVPPGAGRAEKALSKLGLAGEVSGSAMVSGLKAGAVAAAAFGGFEFLKSGIDNFIELAQSIRQFQQASGASATDASRLVGISNALGVSSSSLALGIFRLGKQVGLQPQLFAAQGIAIAKAKDGTTDLVGTLENVAEAYQKTADPARRAQIVYQAFGRAGTTLLPILNANRKQLEEIAKAEATRGHILSQTDINNAYQYQIATRELKDSFDTLALSAAKSIVPALTAVEQTITKITDAIHLVPNLIDKLPGGSTVNRVVGDLTNPIKGASDLLHLTGILGSSNAEAQAKAEQQAADIKAQQDQIEQTVLATLAKPFDLLGGPQAVKGAKQTLNSALSAVTTAKREQAAAMRELSKARAGAPVATSAELTAAQARVTAAEAALTKARYIGGPGVASATASLASAQSSLNNLRAKGGADTNAVANAEDRLKSASERVTAAQRKEHNAQKALNDAHGLNAKEILKRITGQDNSQRALAHANISLAKAGLGQLAITQLDQLNSQIPGTLVRVAHTMTGGIVKALNAREADLESTAELYAKTAADPAIWSKYGERAGESFAKGLGKVNLKSLLTLSVHPKASQFTRVHNPRGGLPGVLSAGITVNTGPVNLKADNPHEMGRKLSRIARQRALGSGQP